MKMTNWLIMFLLTGLFVLPGCGKSKPPETPVQKALTADMPKLRQAFATASPDLQALVDEVSTGLRYGDFRACLAALDKLARAGGVTEAQKKTVEELTAQVKQLASTNPSTPPR